MMAYPMSQSDETMSKKYSLGNLYDLVGVQFFCWREADALPCNLQDNQICGLDTIQCPDCIARKWKKKKLPLPQAVGLLTVGPWKVFYFPPTPYWNQVEAFPDPPPGDAPSRGYRLPRGVDLCPGSLNGVMDIRIGWICDLPL
ncbi:hypothetical protein AVEN_41796-1 [Araneus ventricosus]|uniref:Uncharacterized protein n=1 Tax=Araneus ventricosus TaxID=182803 RepID=A0A4Y2ABW6_ARAVE|nr:hypothetical protein AVEN_41796-1 [Araneus ventricosus]